MIIFQISKDIFKSFFKDKVLRLNLILGLVFNVMVWSVLAWQIKDFPQLMPLHYNIYFGIDYYGPWYQIFILPTIGFVVLIFNFLLGTAIFSREKVLSYFLLGSSTLVQLILLLASISLLLTNS